MAYLVAIYRQLCRHIYHVFDCHCGIALDELAQREEARTSNPILQQIARANVGQAAAPVSLASLLIG